MIVVKFGGTSVAGAGPITAAGEIVRGRLAREPIVVVSALGGATNALLGLATQAAEGQLIPALSTVTQLRERHRREGEVLLAGDAAWPAVREALDAHFDELARLAEALHTLGFTTPRALDAIAAKGELCSALLCTHAFRRLGIAAELVDPRDVMITDDDFMKAAPQAEEIAEAARARLLPLLRDGRVPVLGGFVGGTRQRVTTTLGRGGSDYSASLIGAALQADAIEIWTDVDGMLTADPRVVPDARLIPAIRFDEAAELASFGAKVLHPSTIAPAVKRGIPVYVFNSRRPQGTGTRIAFDAPVRPVTAMAGKGGVTIVKVRTSRMLFAHGFARRVFEVFERHRTAVDVVATSEVSISVTIDDASRLEAIISDLRELGDVAIERQRGIVSLVGTGLSDDAGAMATALGALDGLRVHMLSLSATGINLTILVDDEQVAPAMRRLHAAFFGATVTA
ncbi:MAG: aspartate kinase [Gemmatimonadaceae bacterium]|nr:aspartate kinase [Gemmatimonadaceae bacterium]